MFSSFKGKLKIGDTATLTELQEKVAYRFLRNLFRSISITTCKTSFISNSKSKDLKTS